MKKFLTKLVVGLAALSIVNVDAEACTIMLVTKGASVFVSHCDDGFGNDPNTVFVPAKNHKKGSLRPVYNSAAVSDELNDINHKPHTKAIGHIPEVEHTYAYIDADYPAVNEHGLMLAECTDLCARLPEIPYKEGGGIFYASELGRVAMERCKTAREAIKLMGARQSQCLLPIRTRAGFLKCNRRQVAKAAYGLQKKFLTVITPLRLISLEFTP